MKWPLLLKLCSKRNDDHVAKQLTKAAWSRNSAMLQAPASTSQLSKRHKFEGSTEESERWEVASTAMPIKNITQPCTERSERAISKVSPFCPWTRSAPLEQMLLVPAVARPSSGLSLDEILSSTASASKTLGVQHLISSE